MFNVFEKRKVRRFFFSRTLSIFLFGIFLFLAHAAWGAYQTSSFAHETQREAVLEYTALDERKKMLEAQIAHLGTERGIEAELRSRFDVGREGERLVVLLEPPVLEDAPVQNDSWWSPLVRWFRQ